MPKQIARQLSRTLMRHNIVDATIDSIAVFGDMDDPESQDIAALFIRRPDGSKAVIKFYADAINNQPGWAEVSEWPTPEV